MGVVGGTASALGAGKFSNGAMSGAFTHHMFNNEWRVSLSSSGGVGLGVTYERGFLCLMMIIILSTEGGLGNLM